LKYPYSKISNIPGTFNKEIDDNKLKSSILLKLFSKEKKRYSKNLFSLSLLKGTDIGLWKVNGVCNLDAENSEEYIPCLVR